METMIKLLEDYDNQHPMLLFALSILLLSVVLDVVSRPILNHIAYKKMVKKEGKEYADKFFTRIW